MKKIFKQKIFKQKIVESLHSRAESWVKEAVSVFGTEAIVSIFLYDTEESFITLTENIPSLIFIFKNLDEDNREKLKRIGLPFDNSFRPLFFEENDFYQVYQEFPLDVLAMRNGAVYLYGEEVLNGVDINRDSLKFIVMRDIRSVHTQLLSIWVTGNSENLNNSIFRALGRLLPPFRGVLALREVSVPSSWGSLVSAVESSCSISGFPLTNLISLLENNKKNELSLHTVSLISSLEKLLNSVSGS